MTTTVGLFPCTDHQRYALAGASNMVANSYIREELTEEQRKKWEEEKQRAHDQNRRNESFRAELALILDLLKQGKSLAEAERITNDVIAWGEKRQAELGLE